MVDGRSVLIESRTLHSWLPVFPFPVTGLYSCHAHILGQSHGHRGRLTLPTVPGRRRRLRAGSIVGMTGRTHAVAARHPR